MNSIVSSIIEEAINKSKSYECFSYKQELIKLIDDLDGVQKKCVRIVIDVLSFHMNEDNPKQPFEPYAVLDNKRSAALEDISDEDIDVLINILQNIEDCEFKARVADVIWTRNKVYKYGQEAIDMYLLSANRLKDCKNWTKFYKRARRALKLALLFGRDSDKVIQVNEFIKRTIKEIYEKDSLFLTGKLIELLIEQKDTQGNDFISILETKISDNMKVNDYRKARYYMDVKAKWYRNIGLDDEFQSTIKDIATSYEEEVEYLIEAGYDNYMVIVRLLEDAINTCRRISGMKKTIDKLLLKLEIYKKKVSENLKEFSHTMDITNIVNKIEKNFRNKEKKLCIIKLAFIQSITSKESLKNRVIELQSKAPLSYLASRDIIDKDGRRITSMPNLFVEAEEDRLKALEAHMLREAANNHSIFSSIMLNNALKIIREEHEFDQDDFRFLVRDNMFIMEGREEFFLKGLYEGFKGNFMTAIHLLMPQIEHSFREFARMCGDVVITFEADGKEQYKSLNSIFELPNFVEAYDEDLLFDLKSLLTEKYGSNMRNKFAHGLLSYDEASSSLALYVWWTSLRLCCMYSKDVNQYIFENSDEFYRKHEQQED
ncbi:protein of unknown function [Natronincola peptidivorans]|uniref:Uncharacterized protein n=1 Tax=Natronincola peptidivorans TaxID=426128 RepID=A0A1I0ENR4_9FIRM|nr:DUF4209 domain-containing protein [Natronincola peptidivorans]SET46197.1 protein of unknown function [Natronincola peptidivorans]